MSRKLLSIIAIIIAILLIAWPAKYCYDFFYAPIDSTGQIKSFKVYPGEPAASVTTRLKTEKIITHSWVFDVMLNFLSDHQHLHFGEYDINKKISPFILLKNMVAGKGLVQHRITFVDGWTFDNIRMALSMDANLKQTLSAVKNPAIAALFEKDAPKSPEGLFYPDTYFFTWDNSDVSVLKTAFDKMQSVLNSEWQNRATDLPYKNVYQALIVASLIQRETAIVAEKPIIASVIMNRLQKKMRLQIDPTVQYGLNKSFGDILTGKDLKAKSAYNTYLIPALPPTPICMPNRASIDAALHPATTEYLYYVATGLGGHQFSVTYEQHLQAVKKYHQEEKHLEDVSAQVTSWLHNQLASAK